MSGLMKSAGFKDPLSWYLYVGLSSLWVLFVVARSPLLVLNSTCDPNRPLLNTFPGECFWYEHPKISRYGMGIKIHLAGVIPAGLLAILQFTPSIRRGYPTLHKYVGYVATGAVLYSQVGALMIMDMAFGGSTATQTLVACLALMSTYTLLRGVSEARSRNFMSHRAWMLRTWSMLGAVLSLRPAIFICSAFISYVPMFQQHEIFRCDELLDLMSGKQNLTTTMWPMCDPASPTYVPGALAVVKANIVSDVLAEQIAAMRVSFGPMAWMGVMIHVLAAEIYLSLGPPAPKAAAVTAGNSKKGQ